MVLTDKVLFIAEPPKTGKDSTESFEGKKGGFLRSISTADGKTLFECKLTSPPVWDGMAVGYNKLYLSTMDGNVLCFGK